MALLLCHVRLKVNTVLKQRLIGAVVLIALAVIFLPMLIYSPSPDDELAHVPITAPKAPSSAEFETRVLPLATPPMSNMPSAVPDNSIPAATVEAARAANTPTHSALPPSVAAGNYAVSFGAYASTTDAQVVIAHLQTFNLRGFQHKDSLNGREVWRVRIGPYADRAQAELARLEASKVRSDVNAQVVVLDAVAATHTELAAVAAPLATRPSVAPTNTAGTVSTPQVPTRSEAAPLRSQTPAVATVTETPAVTLVTPQPQLDQIGWAVQVGSFSQAVEATTLRERIRAAGFSAFIEPVNTANGTFHRVRVGPVANRTDAEQLKAQMALRIGVADSLIIRHP